MSATTNPKTNVTIEAGEDELKFKVGLTEFTQFQNEFMPNNKVAPSVNFLNKCVDEEHRDAVNTLCDQGMAIELAQLVSSEFQPAIELKVKK